MEASHCELLLRIERGEKIEPPGPSIRLGWPRSNDTRRSVVGKSPPPFAKAGAKNGSELRFVSVSQRDMEMHYSNTEETLDLPMRWSPAVKNVGEQELLQHFQTSATRALAIMGHTPSKLGDALIRIALASNTASAGALLKSLLAFSSLHRHDVHSQAVELKVDAIKALGVASGSTHIGKREAIQHVATGMLLCSFETHQSTCTSGDWRWYLGSVKQMIEVTGIDKIQNRCDDLAILLDWVYYNDVHDRFAKQYWHRKLSPRNPPTPPASGVRPPAPIITENSSPGMVLTHLLSEVIDAIPAAPPPEAPAGDLQKYNEFIKIIDWRIRSVAITDQDNDGQGCPLILELYRLAVLIYLDRACRTQLHSKAKSQKQVERAFELIPQVKTCDRQFSIFIIGCEARNDEQRALILDLIARTERGGSSRVFNHTPLLMQALWAQEDLAVGEKTDYNERLTSVISVCGIMPTFI
ncbi:fungal-specific transcription factor domain-containing protein [Podospora aff. communis PSN243]|uniref:Fungal-specific transcription factor domain-containing protein n=1 Tax=Podospora aff. communis PSN243 TaxID=3040156 RepID=A0AAV9GQG7_9PEZI|nr:fungal-specific transcription factor domain-containing protein [Podospora aff. communis PSN243]